MSVEEWNSYATHQPWECNDVVIRDGSLIMPGSLRKVTYITSYAAKHTHAVGFDKPFDIGAKENGTNASVLVWLTIRIEA